jgi:apolipoprotein N-acyltransferase
MKLAREYVMTISTLFGNAGESGTSVRLRAFGLLAVTVAVVELVLCFTGPIRFAQRPTLMLFPPFGGNLSQEQIDEISAFIEKQIALTNSYTITSHSFIEEYLVRTDPDFDKSKLKPVDYREAQRIAQELELERFATAWVFSGEDHFELSVSVRDVKEGTTLRSGHFTSDSYENMLRSVDKQGNALEIREKLAVETAGIGFTDHLVLVLLGLQLVVGILALFGRKPGVLVEIVWAPALILFVFAYIYALSANMDYVQRYIASNEQLKLAQNTALEQLYALLRYGPILVLNGAYYVAGKMAPRSSGGKRAANSWVHRYVTNWALPWVLLSAALFGFSFPSLIRLDGLGPLAWISLVPLLLVLITDKPPMAVFYGVVFGALQALIINYWHGTYDYVTLHLITIAFVVEFLLFMIALVGLIKLSGKWGFLVVPAAWLVFDYLRAVGVLGYPWGIIGTTQFRFLPLIHIASITGVWGVDFIVLLCNAAIAWTLIAGAFRWSWIPRSSMLNRSVSRAAHGGGRFARVMTGKDRRTKRVLPAQALFPMAVFAGLFALSIAVGTGVLISVRHRLYGQPEVKTATVVLVQQNTDPRKHEYKENFEKLAELTDRALLALPAKPDLVAWPEGGLKLDIRYWSTPDRRNSYWGRVVQQFRDYQKGLGTWLMTGTQDHEMVLDPEGNRVRRNFNSSVLLDAKGEVNGFYHKINLVPFSEHFPLDKEKFAGLYEMFQKYDISNWGIGEERLVYQHEKMRIATPICFEDVFSDHLRRFVLRDVDIILNMSNDYWSLSPVEGRQHGLFSLFRAVENQRPVLRTTSSGYTVYIDATGRIQPGSPDPYTEGYVIARVPLPEKRLTLYTRWGDWFPIAVAIAVVAFALAGLVSRVFSHAGRNGSVFALQLFRRMSKRPLKEAGCENSLSREAAPWSSGGDCSPCACPPANPGHCPLKTRIARTSRRSAW